MEASPNKGNTMFSIPLDPATSVMFLMWVLSGVTACLFLITGFFTKRLIGKVDRLEQTTVTAEVLHRDKILLNRSLESIERRIDNGFKDIASRIDRHIDNHSTNCPKRMGAWEKQA